VLLLACLARVHADEGHQLQMPYADHLEVTVSDGRETWYVWGSVVFQTEAGWIYCDSAVWHKGETVRAKGRVIIDDEEYHLAADSVDYNLVTDEAVARGAYVELWHRTDSVFAVGTHAYYNQADDFCYMEERPTVYLRYPDTAHMVEVVADFVYCDFEAARTEASGDVRISSGDLAARSGCAVMYTERDVLDLFGQPVAKRKKSTLSGQLITIISEEGIISRIDVVDSARGEFLEPVDSAGLTFDQSLLSGNRILFDFSAGDLTRILCRGQAYSWYFPHSADENESRENSVSGDMIAFDVVEESLTNVSVIGGAVGTYMQRKVIVADIVADTVTDSVTDTVVDTIDYNSRRIDYNLLDSLIILTGQAHVTSGAVSLDAQLVEIDTRTDVVEAFSADTALDSAVSDSSLTSYMQPNPLPVVLRDGNDVLYGDYLEYSIDTEKGRIVQSKSKYQTGFFYGDKLYREKRDIYYLDHGRYTTCDADEPHFHFYSRNIKLLEGEKLIARPVVFYVGRLPVLAIPYYVFPLKKGRHSGWLPFTLGNIERGDRYIRNVGYYWAASDYWDWQGALDYYERSHRINFFTKVNYNKRYTFSGYISGNYARETGYGWSSASETQRTRWTLRGAHEHQVSPTFKLNASGSIQSDAEYYQDFSANLDDRLNRDVRSQVNFSKRFGRSVALSGKVVHDENLDTESRTDQLPSLGLSLPQIRPFGAGKLDKEGKLQTSWYHNLVGTYRPNLVNFSQRRTNKVVLSGDTLSVRSRKEFTRVDHALTLSFPVKIARYITFNPSLSYREEWYKIHQTDQSDAKGIDASTTYRTYVYGTGASASTKIYGTVYPNILGFAGLRQVITPTISYRYQPEIDRHPEIRSYAGGSAGSSRRSQSMNFSLNHVYQAKVKKHEQERNYNLISITSGFNYDFEKEPRHFSNLNTSFNSTVLPKVNFYGSMVHSLYKPGTDELDFWSPYLENFNVNASLTLAGSRFLFDDEYSVPGAEVDSAQSAEGGGSSPAKRGWSLSANYSYRESGRDAAFSKSSFVRFSLRFNLTPETSVSYSQYYNITGAETVNNQVSIVRKLHCWTATLFWVPIGSNRGWGFKLYVTALPQIKLDQSQNTLSSGYFQGLR